MEEKMKVEQAHEVMRNYFKGERTKLIQKKNYIARMKRELNQDLAQLNMRESSFLRSIGARTVKKKAKPAEEKPQGEQESKAT